MLLFLCYITLLALALPFRTLGRSTKSYAALGDSYASGDGAGYITNIICARFSEAYPRQVAQRLPITLTNLACAGSFIDSVRLTQVPWIGDSDAVSIQVGGNEADFFLLLNECIHQWFPVSTCDQEVVRAKSLIQSTSFIQRYNNLVSQTKSSAKPGTLILVMGYARFFNDKTLQCNNVTFSKTDPHNLLTQQKRTAFNDIVAMVNMVARGAAEAHGAVYVDIDEVFEGHRFCEEGVIEPAVDASWFFNDLDTDTPRIRGRKSRLPIATISSGGFFELTRVFHPTTKGHTAIADEIIRFL